MAKQDLVNDLNQLLFDGKFTRNTEPGAMVAIACRDGLITEANKVDVIKILTSLLICDVESHAATFLYGVTPTITVDIVALRTQIRAGLDAMIHTLSYLSHQEGRNPSEFWIKVFGIKRIVNFDPFNVMRVSVYNEHKGSAELDWPTVVDYVLSTPHAK